MCVSAPIRIRDREAAAAVHLCIHIYLYKQAMQANRHMHICKNNTESIQKSSCRFEGNCL